MAGPALLWILGALTVSTGVALVVMLVRAHRARRGGQRESLSDAVTLPPTMPPNRSSPKRTYRTGMLPGMLPGMLADDSTHGPKPERAAMGSDDPAVDDWSKPNLAKICPACGSRYAHERRTCTHDDSELAALN